MPRRWCWRRRNRNPIARLPSEVSDALAAMTWLIGYDCDATAEAQAWETMANAYKDTNYDVYRVTQPE